MASFERGCSDLKQVTDSARELNVSGSLTSERAAVLQEVSPQLIAAQAAAAAAPESFSVFGSPQVGEHVLVAFACLLVAILAAFGDPADAMETAKGLGLALIAAAQSQPAHTPECRVQCDKVFGHVWELEPAPALRVLVVCVLLSMPMWGAASAGNVVEQNALISVANQVLCFTSPTKDAAIKNVVKWIDGLVARARPPPPTRSPADPGDVHVAPVSLDNEEAVRALFDRIAILQTEVAKVTVLEGEVNVLKGEVAVLQGNQAESRANRLVIADMAHAIGQLRSMFVQLLRGPTSE